MSGFEPAAEVTWTYQVKLTRKATENGRLAAALKESTLMCPPSEHRILSTLKIGDLLHNPWPEVTINNNKPIAYIYNI